MGRLYCNGKKGFCERVQGTAEECEKVSCTECDYTDGTGTQFVDQITNYDNIRNMTVDEMAQMINSKTYGCVFRFGCPCDCGENIPEDCVEKIKQWLLQPMME